MYYLIKCLVTWHFVLSTNVFLVGCFIAELCMTDFSKILVNYIWRHFCKIEYPESILSTKLQENKNKYTKCSENKIEYD